MANFPASYDQGERQNGRNFATIFFRALLISLSMLAWPHGAIGQGNDLEAQDWRELCDAVDCDEFPEFHYTVQVGEDRFFVPFRSALNVEAETNTGAYYVFLDGYRDRRSDGSIHRIVSTTVLHGSNGYERLSLTLCCRLLLEHFAKAEGWPDIGAGNVAPQIALYLLPGTSSAKEHNLSWHLANTQNRPPTGAEKADFDPTALPDFGQAFWLVEAQDIVRSSSGNSRKIKILSKEPVLNGRFVYGICSASCRFSTLGPKQDMKAVGPHVRLENMWIRGYRPESCDDGEVSISCDKGIDAFDRLPVVFNKFEELISALMHVPE